MTWSVFSLRSAQMWFIPPYRRKRQVDHVVEVRVREKEEVSQRPEQLMTRPTAQSNLGILLPRTRDIVAC